MELAASSAPNGVGKDGAWVLVDGRELGLGTLLEKVED
eukprot:SAG31_NODE_10388_length_1145_cov_0.843212_2_plen_38_part_00